MRWLLILVILLVGCTPRPTPAEPTSIPVPSRAEVIFPAEGDVLVKGETYELRWTGGEETIAIFLHDKSLETLGVSVSISDRIYGVANTGSYSFTVPETLKDGIYRLEIGDGTSGYFGIVSPGYSLYENPFFNVLFAYPATWAPDPDYSPPIPAEGLPYAYRGEDGYFVMTALAGPMTLAEAVDSIAYHKLRPFGESPIIEERMIAGMEGAVILPGEEGIEAAAMVVWYPAPVTIEHSPGQFGTYAFLVIDADKDYIEKIADTLSFLEYPRPGD